MSDFKSVVISVIIPTRNEQDYIEECINSLLDCDEPWYINNTEFIIVDGMSTDNTVNIVKEKFGHLKLKVLENPNLYQAYAMNIGIKNSDNSAEYSIVIRADAHSRYPTNYIWSCYLASFNSIGGNAGSIQKAVGTSFFTRIVADVMNSGYAMGGVKYRKIDDNDPFSSTKYIDSDTAYLGCWRTSDLIKWNGFNEEFQINEDYELNIRIRKAKGRITVNKNLIVDYFVRSSLLSLIKQFFRYGLWKTKTLSLHPDSLKLRQLAPVLFVLFLLTLGIGNLILTGDLLLFINASSLLIGTLWLVMILLIWKNSSNLFSILFIPIVVLSMHISWGLGFLYGLMRWARGGWNKS